MIDDRGSILHPHSFSGIPGSVIRHGSKILASFSGDRILCASATSLTVLPLVKASLAIFAARSCPITGASAVSMARLCSTMVGLAISIVGSKAGEAARMNWRCGRTSSPSDKMLI
jgi:hypothetical protein